VLRTLLSPKVSLVLLRAILGIFSIHGELFRSALEASYLRPARCAARAASRRAPRQSSSSEHGGYAAFERRTHSGE
jgi:hypothetical protein